MKITMTDFISSILPDKGDNMTYQILTTPETKERLKQRGVLSKGDTIDETYFKDMVVEYWYADIVDNKVQIKIYIDIDKKEN